MDINIPPRRHTVGEPLTSASNNRCVIKRCLLLNKHWTQQFQQWCQIVILLLRSRPSSTRQKLNFFQTLFVSILLTSQVVVESHHHHSGFNNVNNNTGSANGARRSRYAGTASQNGATTESPSQFVMRPEFFTVPIGGVIHLFPRYGYLSLSMKVIARNNSNGSTASSNNRNNVENRNESWMFLEPINNVIEPSTLKVEETTFSSVNDSSSLPFHNLFHFDLCEDIRALMEAYFKNFSVEGLDKSWQAFAGGWRTASIARNFGIEQHFVDGDYRFVLVKVMLVRGSGTVEEVENTTVASGYKSNFQRFKPDNDLSSYEFFKVVGTHYIHSYIVGNAIYQVFVYDPDGFQAVKKRLFFDGIKDESIVTSTEPILESLSMWVRYIGRVVILNAEAGVTESVRKALVMHSSYTHPQPNLLKLHDNASLVTDVESMLSSQPSGILGIDLRGIQFLFNDPIQRNGFEKALKHKMQLWEINFLY